MSQDTQETMTDHDVTADAPVGEADATLVAIPQRPAEVPEKFWDPASGAVRTEALLKSYLELERKMGLLSQVDGPLNESARVKLLDMLGRPPSADDYRIEPPHGLIEPDPTLNARLHEAGFTQGQAQLVYELAAERLLPAVAEVVGELESQRHLDQLQRHFGGAEAWRGTARQIRTWAEGNLDPEVYGTLAGSPDGVLALYQMMRAAEPTLLDSTGSSAGQINEDALGEMVRDPRYWRQRDPEFVARVTAGFKKLYGG